MRHAPKNSMHPERQMKNALNAESVPQNPLDMMTSSNGNMFRVTGPLWEEFTDGQFPSQRPGSDAELLCLLRLAPEQRVQ